jgi:FkbM family methyltransferase
MKLHEPSGWWVPDFFPSGPGSYIGRSASIEYALGLVKIKHRTVIQAGGHVGVWPKKLAQTFEKVVTFEPVPSNWECLFKNMEGTDVELHCLALGAKKGLDHINHRKTSSGGHHIATHMAKPHIPVSMVTLDDTCEKYLGTVDALFLDIEGYEIEALKGATQMLLNDHPLLVVENNGCSQKFGYGPKALHEHLKPYGYTQIGAHGEDLVFYCGDV